MFLPTKGKFDITAFPKAASANNDCRLLDVYDSQKRDAVPWSDSAGYVNVVKDARNQDYLRFYVGQSREIRRRIPYHISEILSGSANSLHYFICSRGRGFRSAMFVRL